MLTANGPATIYYTTDGTTPTTSSTVYTTPIIVSQSLSLKFFAVDPLGNAETVKTETYVITGAKVWAWGANTYGRLGDGTNTNRHSPVQTIGLTDMVAVAGGGFHTLAQKSDGTVWA